MSDLGDTPPVEAGFAGLTVVSFESRRSAEMASLITRHGGVALRAPSMREIPHEDNAGARAFAAALRARSFDLVVLMTGVGTRALQAAVAPEMPAEELASHLAATTVVARGPKPAAVLRELGVKGFHTAPEPNSWREVLGVVRGLLSGSPARVAIQEHGAPSPELCEALRDDGCTVESFSVYQWALPEDTGPLRRALHAIADGQARVALFTSATQVVHALRIACTEGIEDDVRRALGRGVVASIGPVCSDALRGAGLAPDLEPEHPRMGHLVKSAAELAGGILARKGPAPA